MDIETENAIVESLKIRNIKQTADLLGISRYHIEVVNDKHKIRTRRIRITEEKRAEVRQLYFSKKPFYTLKEIAVKTRIGIASIVDKIIKPHEYRQNSTRLKQSSPATIRDQKAQKTPSSDYRFSIYPSEKQGEKRIPFHQLLKAELQKYKAKQS